MRRWSAASRCTVSAGEATGPISRLQPTIDSVKAQLDRLFSNDDAVIVVVSNEIGLGGVSPNKMQRNFCDIQGTLNQYVASLADEAYLIVAGLPLRLK